MREGSKGVKDKNLRLLNKKHLMRYTIDQALDSKLFEHVVVSTDSKKISFLAKKFGAKCWFLRPKKLSTDKSAKEDAIKHAFLQTEKFYNEKYDILVDLDATSPLRNINDIKKSINKFIQEKTNTLITVCKARRNPYFNMIEIINGKPKIVKNIPKGKKIIRRQDAPNVYEMNASIYIWNRKAIINNYPAISSKTSIYFMPMDRSIDIDSEFEWKLVDYLMKNKK
jgi:CMP-N,N'-diacetyllegionaminic acid synthase